MSGSSDITQCPRCGQEHFLTYADWKPHDLVSGMCLDCGYAYRTVTNKLTLDEVNEEREIYNSGLDDSEVSFSPLTELAVPTPDWLKWNKGLEP